MSGSDPATLSAARLAYEQRKWEPAYQLFTEADAEKSLGADDLERQAWAARWCGKYDEEFVALERAEKLYMAAGDRRGAARIAMQFGYGMYTQRKEAVAMSCIARAAELLAEAPEIVPVNVLGAKF